MIPQNFNRRTNVAMEHNWCFPAFDRLGKIGGKAGLAAFLKQQRWDNSF